MHLCGLFHTPFVEAVNLLPEYADVLRTAPTVPGERYIVDVKIHMLMPGQYPCIPNWHRDMVPRDNELNPLPELIDPEKIMMLWVSGPPLTEFRDGREVKPRTWVQFTQEDEHRGVASEIHTWRTFIRLVPEPLLKPARSNQWLRRHSQVYLDASNFSW